MENICQEKGLTGYPSVDKPWLKYYSEEAINASLPECTMYEYIHNNNENNLDDISLVYFGRKITYEQLFYAIDQTAAAFAALGVKKGDIVTIQALIVPQVVFAIYALNKIGAIANLIYADMDSDRVKSVLAGTDSRLLLVMEPIYRSIKAGLADADLKAIIVIGVQDEMDFITKTVYNITSKALKLIPEDPILTWNAFFDMGKDIDTPVSGQGADPAIMVYTGGTSGKSKAVVLTNSNVNSGALQYLYLGFERRKTMLCALPPFIAFGITVTLHTPLAFGLRTALCVSTDMSEIGGFVQRYKPNYIICGTAQAEKLMKKLQDKRINLSFLRCLSVGGDAFPQKMEDRLNEFLISHNAKIKVAQGYAMSETSAAAAASTRTIGTTVYKEGTVGVPLVHTNVKIIDQDTREMLEYNQIGEICISGPCTMHEYFKNSEETHNILQVHDDGATWVHTGDIGSVDEDGFITVAGRIKRMILTFENGVCHKIFPKLLEDGFLTCDCIKQISVVGKSGTDISLSNELVAFVVVEDGVSEEFALTALTEYADKYFETYERPNKYFFIRQLPLTTIGKVDYRSLEKLAE